MPPSPRSLVALATVAAALTAGCSAPTVAADEPPTATAVTTSSQTISGQHGTAVVPGAALVATSDSLRYQSVTGDDRVDLVTFRDIEVTAVAVRPGSTPGDLVAIISGYDDLGHLWWLRDDRGTVTWGALPEMGSYGEMRAVWSPDGSHVSWTRDPREEVPGAVFTAAWSELTGQVETPPWTVVAELDSPQVLFDWREDADGDSRYAHDSVEGGVTIYRHSPDGTLDVIRRPSETTVAAVHTAPADEGALTGSRPGGPAPRVFVVDRPVSDMAAPATLTLRATDADDAIEVSLPVLDGRWPDHNLAASLDAAAMITLLPGQQYADRTFALVESDEQGTTRLVAHAWPFGDDVIDVAFLPPPRA